ncbi:glycoside hydrolase family 1 protein [Candidatus Saccharibacteria bacterium]|nr:glycoside hydrolase family 1 protein [Candidatus Saccharibacteria bacterium]
MPEDTKPVFPKNFLWGGSTSSHQVEGGNYNQWTVWEQKNAEHLAKNAESLLNWRWNSPVWPEIKKQAMSPDNYISGRGVEHYSKYKQDFDLLKSLNLNTLRFSIEWSRIEPEEGKWNQSEVEHYRRYIAELKKRDIEPVLNVWHWTVPVWFDQKGGFKYRKNLKYFNRFVHLIAKEFAKDLKYVITLNEPNVYASYSHQLGLWPPQEKNPLSMARVYWNLTKAHKSAYYLLKHENHRLQVGVASQLANIQSKNPHDLFGEMSTKVMRYFWNWWFLNRIKREQDFVGVNYYFTDYYNGWFKHSNPKVPLNDLGWYMEPEGLYPLLLRAWAHYKKPIIVTENGVADMHDEYRRWWLEETIVSMRRAMSQGVVIKGYFYWSLLDNFEWSQGWWPKFGLIEVDRKNGMKRRVRESSKWLAERIEKLSP